MRFFEWIVGLLLVATLIVAGSIFALGGWLTEIAKYWSAVFGFSPTTHHILIWAILFLATTRFFWDIREVGRKYARTPNVNKLLQAYPGGWLVVFVLLVTATYGILENLWPSWILYVSMDYGVILVPLGYFFVGVLLPFLLGCVSDKSTPRRRTQPKAMERLLQICSDDPIQTQSQDSLLRGKFVHKMYNLVDSYDEPGSLVIGMNGGWGDGKTSVLHLLKEKLRKERGQLLVVDFNPWYFNDESSLLKEFFRSITRELGRRFLIPNVKNRIRSIVRLLRFARARAGPMELDLAAIARSSEDDIIDLKKGAQEVLRGIDKKVLIIIDDVDRLTPLGVLLVFKLVRLCADFPKFVYLLSFDRAGVCDLLRRTYVVDPDAFLHKIIQIDLRLPQVDRQKIDGLLDEWLDELFGKIGIVLKDSERERLAQLSKDLFPRQIRNVRDTRRLIAALVGVLDETKREVNVVDVIGLEALRIFAHPVWRDVSTAWDYYVCPMGIEYEMHRVRSLGVDDAKQVEQAKTHLTHVLGEEDTEGYRFAKGIVEFLFPAATDALQGRKPSYEDDIPQLDNQQRVALLSYFKKYLQQHVPIYIVRDEEKARLVQQANESRDPVESSHIIAKAFADHERRDLVYDLLQKLINTRDELDGTGDDVIVRAICEYSDRFSDTPRGLRDSDMDRARALLYVIGNKHHATDRIQQILRDAILNSRSIYFASSIVIWCDPKHNHIIQSFDNIKVVELKDAYKERFKREYVEPKKDILATDPSVVRYLLYPIDDRALSTAYMLSLFEGRPAHAGTLLLLYATDRHISTDPQRWIFQYDDLKAKFEIEKLYDFVKTLKDEAYENNDEKWAVETFMKLHEQKTESPQASQG